MTEIKRKVKKFSMFPLLLILFLANTIQAHCEIPCGIYHDSLRINLVLEHITTLEKSMNQINSITESNKPNYNQLVRWVTNKEEHAVKIQDIVSQYFLHQRIKITDPDNKEKYTKYLTELELLHKVLVYSMKSKQTTDLSFIEKLRSTVNEFSSSYFSGHKH